MSTRTAETVFKAWMYRAPLDAEERRRLVEFAREILDDHREGWPFHQPTADTDLPF